jgi:TldD protein
VLEQALSKGGDFADLYFQHRLGRSLALEDGKVNRAHSSVDLGAGVRVVRGDQTGYAFTEELTDTALLQAARTASTISQGSPGLAAQSFQVQKRPEFYPVREPWSAVGIDRKKPLLDEMNRLAFSQDRRIKKVRISFQDQTEHILVADSDGRWAEDERPMGTLGISCVAEHGQRREENWANRAWRKGIEAFDSRLARELAREAVDRTIMLFEAVQPEPGEMPVVLAAGSSGILLHEAIGHGMEADFNRKQISIYTEKMGERIARPFVSIVDDGTLAGARGAINVDDEGIPAQNTTLVEQGILRSFMHDRISARHFDCQPTGNGRRQSFRHKPLPRMRCTYMLPGPHRKQEIIGSVKQGLLAVTFSNGQVQIGAGDFTFFVKTGYLIENGKVTRPIKDTNIIGNGPEVLQRVEMVADDLQIDPGRWTCGKDGQGVPVSQGLPTVKVARITVGGVKS